MIRDILGIISDIIGIVFVWWKPDVLGWGWKVVITIALIAVAIVFYHSTKNRPIARLTAYFWDEDEECITLIANKNRYYSTDMLVSIYTKNANNFILCAIGYVKMDPQEKKLHVQVVHQIDRSAMARIRSSPKKYKEFFVKPSVTQKDVSAIKWE